MKKLLSFLLMILLCLTLAGCEEYEDTNGADDFTLQTITDENIIKMDIGSSGLTYKETNVGGLKTSEYSSKNFNGVDEIYVTSYILESDVEIYIGHMSVEKGNFKLAVILDDEIIKEIPLDAFSESYYFEDIKGDFSVRVAGESAAFEFYIDIY